MCGIAGAISLNQAPISLSKRRLAVMNEMQKHRGPDGEGSWLHPRAYVGFAHRRLSLIDLATGEQS